VTFPEDLALAELILQGQNLAAKTPRTARKTIISRQAAKTPRKPKSGKKSTQKIR
jgi:hypothetical protein